MDFNFNNSNYPILESERLILKRITKEHVDDVLLIRSDPAMKFIPRPICKNREDAFNFINISDQLTQQNIFVNFGIFLKDDDSTMIGTIGYVRMNKDNFRGEIGYVLREIYQRKGYMFEALNLVIDFGFNIMKFHTIEAHIDPTNIPSQAIIQKCGFKLEAQFKENFFHPVEKIFRDTNVYCKINPNK